MKAVITMIFFKYGLMLAVLLLTLQTARAADVVAKVSFVRGSVAAILNKNKSRILGKDAPIYEGDNIQTVERSFVILIFNNGAKITVRPNSSFSIKEYSDKQGKQNAKMELHKGGIRASTGNIAKNEPDKFQIKTPLTTVKANQADYSVRLCEQDCEQEVKKLKNKKVKPSASVAARVVKVKGKVTAKNTKESESERVLVIGSPLYSGDQITSQKNSHVILAFSDGGRITINESTQYALSKYQYQEKGKEDKSIHKLFKGGLRVLTGRIGKVKKKNYKIDTPIATIGIRGTGFDLHCGESCRDNKHSKKRKGLFTKVWLGSVEQRNDSGVYVLNLSDINYIANQSTPPVKLSKFPTSISQHLAERPDRIVVDLARLFKISSLKNTPSGLYVTVHKGYVRLGKGLHLGKGESAYVNRRGKIIRITPQIFQIEDVYPLPSTFDGQKTQTSTYSLLRDKYKGVIAPVYECFAE